MSENAREKAGVCVLSDVVLEKAAFYQQQDKVIKSPYDKIPRGSVPDSGEQPYYKKVENFPRRGAAVAAERDVYIVPKPCGKGDVPASPEIGDGTGNIRVTEIFFKMKSEHFSETDCHIGIAGKVKINLEGICDGSEPCKCHGELVGRRIKCRIGNLGHGVGDQDLFCQTDNKSAAPLGKVCDGFMAVIDFIGDCFIADNRSGNELRKEGNI